MYTLKSIPSIMCRMKLRWTGHPDDFVNVVDDDVWVPAQRPTTETRYTLLLSPSLLPPIRSVSHPLYLFLALFSPSLTFPRSVYSLLTLCLTLRPR